MSTSYQWCPLCRSPLHDVDRGEVTRRACSDPSCDFVHWDNPAPVVAALVEHDGAIVIARNKGWPEDWFGLVTGFLERGESPEAATLREVDEELGLRGEIVDLIGVYSFETMHQVIIAYHVVAHGEIALGDELAAVKRVRPERLRAWPFGTGHAVSDWIERGRVTVSRNGSPEDSAPGDD